MTINKTNSSHVATNAQPVSPPSSIIETISSESGAALVADIFFDVFKKGLNTLEGIVGPEWDQIEQEQKVIERSAQKLDVLKGPEINEATVTKGESGAFDWIYSGLKELGYEDNMALDFATRASKLWWKKAELEQIKTKFSEAGLHLVSEDDVAPLNKSFPNNNFGPQDYRLKADKGTMVWKIECDGKVFYALRGQVNETARTANLIKKVVEENALQDKIKVNDIGVTEVKVISDVINGGFKEIALWAGTADVKPVEKPVAVIDVAELTRLAKQDGIGRFNIFGETLPGVVEVIGFIQKSINALKQTGGTLLYLKEGQQISLNGEVKEGNGFVDHTAILNPNDKIEAPGGGLKIEMIDSRPTLLKGRKDQALVSANPQPASEPSKVINPMLGEFFGEIAEVAAIGGLFLGAEAVYKAMTHKNELSRAELELFGLLPVGIGAVPLMIGKNPLSFTEAVSKTVEDMAPALPFFLLGNGALAWAGMKGDYEIGPVSIDKKSLWSLPLGATLFAGAKTLLKVVGGSDLLGLMSLGIFLVELGYYGVENRHEIIEEDAQFFNTMKEHPLRTYWDLTKYVWSEYLLPVDLMELEMSGIKWVGGKAVKGVEWTGGKIWNGTKRAGREVADGTVSGLNWVGGKMVDGANAIGDVTVKGANAVGEGVIDGTKAIWHETKWARKEFYKGGKWVTSKVGDGIRAGADIAADGLNRAEEGAQGVQDYVVNETIPDSIELFDLTMKDPEEVGSYAWDAITALADTENPFSSPLIRDQPQHFLKRRRVLTEFRRVADPSFEKLVHEIERKKTGE